MKINLKTNIYANCFDYIKEKINNNLYEINNIDFDGLNICVTYTYYYMGKIEMQNDLDILLLDYIDFLIQRKINENN